MTRTSKVLIVLVVATLGVWGCAQGPVSHSAQGDKILTSVFCDGGIDSLSVLAPVGDPKYTTLRKALADLGLL